MKKCLDLSLIYAAAALISGVFYREFTKWNGYYGTTALGKIHVHLFVLGMIVFLVAALFSKQQDLEKNKMFCAFLWVYNTGLPITAVMMAVRGVIQVLNISLTDAADAAISGIAGIGHLLTGTGIILFLVSLKKSAKNERC